MMLWQQQRTIYLDVAMTRHCLFFSLYGFFSIQSTSFPRTRLLSESYLKKYANSKFGFWGKDVYDVTLLGAAQYCNRKKKGPPDLIYAVSSHQPRAEINNLIQAGAAILSQSRTIFFGKVLCLLRHYDPRKMELLYTGKTC
jgi:hypothetical protein